MLSQQNVAEAAGILERLRSGKQACSKELEECIGVILYAMDRKRLELHKERLCDWLFWHKDSEWFMKDVREKLTEVLSRNGSGISCGGLFELQKYKQTILDHHYWNDCDPFWYQEGKGRYGSSPGEDILLKLIEKVYIGHRFK